MTMTYSSLTLTSTSFEHTFGPESVALITLWVALGALLVANLGALLCYGWRRCQCAGAAPGSDRDRARSREQELEEQERMRERAWSWPESALPRHLLPRHLRTQAVTFALRKQTSTSTSISSRDGTLGASWHSNDGDSVHLFGLDSAQTTQPHARPPFGF